MSAEFERIGVRHNQADFLTTRELSREWGMSVGTVRQKLQMAHDAGILEVGKKQVASISGDTSTRTAYRIKLPTKRKR